MLVYINEDTLTKNLQKTKHLHVHILLKNSISDDFRSMAALKILKVYIATSIVDHWSCQGLKKKI